MCIIICHFLCYEFVCFCVCQICEEKGRICKDLEKGRICNHMEKGRKIWTVELLATGIADSCKKWQSRKICCRTGGIISSLQKWKYIAKYFILTHSNIDSPSPSPSPSPPSSSRSWWYQISNWIHGAAICRRSSSGAVVPILQILKLVVWTAVSANYNYHRRHFWTIWELIWKCSGEQTNQCNPCNLGSYQTGNLKHTWKLTVEKMKQFQPIGTLMTK